MSAAMPNNITVTFRNAGIMVVSGREEMTIHGAQKNPKCVTTDLNGDRPESRDEEGLNPMEKDVMAYLERWSGKEKTTKWMGKSASFKSFLSSSWTAIIYATGQSLR
jgi:hypothetical protein